MTTEKLINITLDVGVETRRQDAKWGDQRTLPGPMWMAILGEEYGEVCKAVLEKNTAEARAELIQVDALCYQIIDAIDAEKFNNR